MAYTALYRKWRPKSFDEVVGQEAVVRTLTNQVVNNRIGHAYLFCGTRGTGKTTIAKIFARAVNCEHPVNGSPCNECEACKAIMAGNSMNVVEIDAASNNGVDNIREIRDEVKYSPTEGKYRVYIIDEVHMLSAGAYNALLKTLEEPPEYVIFILATTEVHKIPVTVLSRCQRYDFKRISASGIEAQLKKITEAEGIETEPAALTYISRAADGAMRDALSILEECVSYHYGSRLTYENVLDIVGATETDVFARLLDSIVNLDVTAAMKIVEELVFSGRDITQSVGDFVWFLRNLLLIQTSSVSAEDLGVTVETLRELEDYAVRVSRDNLMNYIEMFSALENSLRTSTEKRTLLEVSIIRAMRPESETDYNGMKARIAALEKAVETIASGQIEGFHPAAVTNEEAAGQPGEVVRVSPATHSDITQLQKHWRSIMSSVRGCFTETDNRIVPSYREGLGFLIVCRRPYNTKIIEDPERLSAIEKAASSALNKEIHFTVKSDADENPNKDFVADSNISTPKLGVDIGMEE